MKYYIVDNDNKIEKCPFYWDGDIEQFRKIYEEVNARIVPAEDYIHYSKEKMNIPTKTYIDLNNRIIHAFVSNGKTLLVHSLEKSKDVFFVSELNFDIREKEQVYMGKIDSWKKCVSTIEFSLRYDLVDFKKDISFFDDDTYKKCRIIIRRKASKIITLRDGLEILVIPYKDKILLVDLEKSTLGYPLDCVKYAVFDSSLKDNTIYIGKDSNIKWFESDELIEQYNVFQ